MSVVGRLAAAAGGVFVLASAAGAVGAAMLKERLVRVEDPEADDVKLVAVFEPLYFTSTAQSFRGGTVDCWYGGGTIDLRGATIDPAGALLRVRAIFGGAQLVVPADWTVTSRVTGIGGVGDSRKRPEGAPIDAPQLSIEGTAVFGGLGITSELSDEKAAQARNAVVRYRQRRGAAPAAPPETTM